MIQNIMNLLININTQEIGCTSGFFSISDAKKFKLVLLPIHDGLYQFSFIHATLSMAIFSTTIEIILLRLKSYCGDMD